jgi:hypothetical protein
VVRFAVQDRPPLPALGPQFESSMQFVDRPAEVINGGESTTEVSYAAGLAKVK